MPVDFSSESRILSESNNNKVWNPRVYTKLYRSIFDGSLYGKFEPLTTFMALLALADYHGEVDASPERIAGSLGCDVAFVLKGLKSLEAPDPHSRTPDENGRRIVRLCNENGEKRAFGWRIVNYKKYRELRNSEERREYQRQWDRLYRGKSDKSDKSDRKTTYTDTDKDKDKEKSKALAAQETAPPPAIITWIPLRGGGQFGVSASFIAELEPCYPAVDIPATLLEMRGWCLANPDRLKTKQGVKRFIGRWLKEEQEKHGG
jgi:hypothetical protein